MPEADRLAALEARVQRIERMVQSGTYLDRAIRMWRAEAPEEHVGVLEGETRVTYTDVTVYGDMTVDGVWVIADRPGGATNAAGKTGVSIPEV